MGRERVPQGADEVEGACHQDPPVRTGSRHRLGKSFTRVGFGQGLEAKFTGQARQLVCEPMTAALDGGAYQPIGMALESLEQPPGVLVTGEAEHRLTGPR